MTLQEKLKSATNDSHNKLEQLMYVGEIMQKTLNLDQYKQLLLTNYLVHQNYEETIFDQLTGDLKDAIEPQKRVKLKALELDLEEADLLTHVSEISKERLEINFEGDEAIGGMYVLEGATLGGNVIYKKLVANPNFENQQLQFNYYKVYGENLMPNWVSFVQILNSIPEERHENIVNGALKMFDTIAKTSQQLSVKL